MSQELREEARRRERERRLLDQKESELVEDLYCVATTPEGKRFLRRLLDNGDMFGSAWTPGAAGAYQAGRRAQALELWRLLREHLPRQACADLILPVSDNAGAADGEGTADWDDDARSREYGF